MEDGKVGFLWDARLLGRVVELCCSSRGIVPLALFDPWKRRTGVPDRERKTGFHK